MNNCKNVFWAIFIFLLFDILIWHQILFNKPGKNTELYFFDVGQGDSELAILPDKISILIDGGPNNKVINELSSILPIMNRYIDLVILSHPQADHFAGLIDVLKRYKIGAFVFSGKSGNSQSFNDLEKIIKENKIPVIVLGEGDKIKTSETQFDILSPSKKLLQSNEPNDWAIVVKMIDKKITALFTGDIDSKIENDLVEKYGSNLNIDILKVSHHGSKFSSSDKFLQAATPKISVIEVGKNNYGHPSNEVLNKLATINSQIFRTDKNGAVKIIIDGSKINVLKEK